MFMRSPACHWSGSEAIPQRYIKCEKLSIVSFDQLSQLMLRVSALTHQYAIDCLYAGVGIACRTVKSKC